MRSHSTAVVVAAILTLGLCLGCIAGRTRLSVVEVSRLLESASVSQAVDADEARCDGCGEVTAVFRAAR